MSSDTRPPITCHILDTLTGKPAADILVRLTLVSPSPPSGASITFQQVTNSDGRIAGWSNPDPSHPTLQSVFENMGGEMLWVCRFETRAYFEEQNIKPFFPEVEIRFLTEGYQGRSTQGDGAKAHWHVPLLLGPYSYTTYRGS